MAVHPQRDGELRRQPQDLVVRRDLGQELHGPLDAAHLIFLLFLPFRHKSRRIVLVFQTAFDDLRPFIQILLPGDVNRQGEAIQKLGPDVPLFRVHSTHQGKPRRMGIGNALPLHSIDAHGR